jgi:hypothetical protein
VAFTRPASHLLQVLLEKMQNLAQASNAICPVAGRGIALILIFSDEALLASDMTTCVQDFGRRTFRKAADFEVDDMILSKSR